MTLVEIFQLIEQTAQEKGLSTPFICGGTPRDKIMGRLNQLADVDITTGDASVFQLAKEVAVKLPGSKIKTMADKHSQIMLDDLKIDFSSNFLVPNIVQMLKGVGIEQPTPLQCELFSRDFTCNALLMSIDLEKIYDPTGLGIKDIQNKFLRTCLPARITLGSQGRRVIRIIYLAVKLGFEVDPEIIDWVKKNPKAILDAKPRQISEKIETALNIDKTRTIQLLDEMKLWDVLPGYAEMIKGPNV
jgi:tRNA nucleotidyltransferase/poly(A) polymerase